MLLSSWLCQHGVVLVYCLIMTLFPARIDSNTASLVGLGLVLGTSLRYGLWAGMLATVWASSILLLTAALTPGVTGHLQLLTMIISYICVAALLGSIAELAHHRRSALQNSEERLRDVLDSQGELICRFSSSDRTLTHVNQAFGRYFGKTAAELVGSTFLPSPQYEGEGEWNQLDSDSSVSTYEYRMVLPTGKVAYQQWVERAVLNEDGTSRERQAVGRDITEAKRSEEKLRSQLSAEKTVAAISTAFLNLPVGQVDKGIDHALRLTGEFFQVDRSYVFGYAPDGRTMDNTHEWCAPGIAPQRERIQNFPVQKLPWFAREIRSKRYVHIPDVDLLPPEAKAEHQEFSLQNIQSLLAIPMYKDGALLGFLGFDVVREKRTWKEEQITLLQVMAELITSALVQHQAAERIRQLSYHDNLTGLYNRSYLEEEIMLLDVKGRVPISLVMADLNGLKLVNDTYGHHAGDEMLRKLAAILRQSCRAEDIVARWGGDEFIILVPDTTSSQAEQLCRRIQVCCAQEVVEDIPISVALGAATAEQSGMSLFQLLRLAEDAMYEHKLTESRSAKSAVLHALITAVEAKSFETPKHVLRMQNLALRMAQKLDLPEPELRRLLLLITLHDVGKISIPETVLNKPGALSEDEWELMKKHPETGYRIARATDEFAHVADGILCHHERWDGGGYPRGLSGQEIPLLARITAIADAYEVMSNGRPYRAPLMHREIVDELVQGAGSHFDPELVTIALDILEEGKEDHDPGPGSPASTAAPGSWRDQGQSAAACRLL